MNAAESFKDRFRHKLMEMFGLDFRSLAIFRIGMAVVMVGDLVIRSTDLRMFYTDEGVLPRAALWQNSVKDWTISLHFWNATVLFQGFLFLLAGLAGIGLLIGFRTRWMTCVCWALTTSLHTRNFLVCQGGDDYLRMSLFWSMFLPLGARWSVDSVLNSASEKLPVRLLSWGSFALIAQTILLYVSTAMFKSRGTAWWEGTALYYALSLDCFAKRPAFYLLLFPSLLKWMTRGVLAFEGLGSFLLISPIWNGPIRTLGVLGFISLHTGIMTTMAIGPFQCVSIVAATAFLPSWFWEQGGVLLKKYGNRPVTRTLSTSLGHCKDFILSHLPRRPLAVQPSRLNGLCVIFFLSGTIWWDASQLYPTQLPLPHLVDALCHAVDLKQGWAMFSPNVSKTSGWFVIPGKLRNGRIVDLFAEGRPLSWAPPPLISAYYKNERRRKYLMNMRVDKLHIYRINYSFYLCRSWNESHQGDETLESLQVVFVDRHTLPDDRMTTYERSLLWDAYCSPEGKTMDLPVTSLHMTGVPRQQTMLLPKQARRTQKHINPVFP